MDGRREMGGGRQGGRSTLYFYAGFGVCFKRISYICGVPASKGVGAHMMMKDVCLTFCFRGIKLRKFNRFRKQGSSGRSWGMREQPACRHGMRVYHSISAWASSLLILESKALRRPNTRDEQEFESRAFCMCAIVIELLYRQEGTVRFGVPGQSYKSIYYEDICMEPAADDDSRPGGKRDLRGLHRRRERQQEV